MANFDEDIKRITDEILSDGTVDQIISGWNRKSNS